MKPNPAAIDKYLYIRNTQAWKVKSLYFFGIISWLLVSYGYFFVIGVDPIFTFVLTPVTIFLTVYHLLSFGLNLFYKQFDIKKHNSLIENFSKTGWNPSIDVFLPICGEDFSVLKNTWKYVSKLKYSNLKVYVLDDSNSNTQLHRKLAEQFGFTYYSRPNRGEMKKAGNLKYGFDNSNGEYIVVFDADFAPHPDFLNETLPYMRDYSVGIVQTPQYFETTELSHKRNPLSYNAALAEEPFYRFIQVARGRFNAVICCGSNALYRRATLEAIGGPYQIDYSEDAHTGFEMVVKGFKVLYIPVILAIGSCPDNYYTFFHQQHRWCMGSMRLMLSKKFWLARVALSTKLCYITGFMFYLHHPVILLFSFHLFWVLFLYNDLIPGSVDYLYYPHLLFAIIYIWAFPIAKIKPGYFLLLIARTYAYSHAVITSLTNGTVGWISTNAKHSKVSNAFNQTLLSVFLYVLFYLGFTLVGLRTGDVKILDVNYWSLQFWIIYNLGITILLFVRLFVSKLEMGRRSIIPFAINKL